ncbi:guanosine-diphosphatase, putative [Schistosoma mansoni]|uniref:guanosine-diphosphatase, putative n=1 Tax=Schistosoma mansoni TaxID=6183 RepID=UPI0001A6227B|nr:guanosine-diphosphatase, putative [Schistosoma mansoni]|eukprot:XP_018644327.1 guanosine-diphosphatase, putative [Schistosoma mansoni]
MHTFEAAPVGQNYIIIVDAGSSGSRMFVYTWQIKAESLSGLEDVEILKDVLGNPVVKKKSPGLSSFADKLSDIRDYISALLDYAESHIPRSSQPNTPLFIMATAGMRLLTQTNQDAIWRNVRSHVKSTYKFQFEETYAYTISGVEEGLFGWIAVNYLLGRFRLLPGDEGPVKQPTNGMLDMGGASMQIAYEVQSTDNLPNSLVSEFSVTRNWFSTNQRYKLYVKSYLGYGMNSFRKRYEEYLFQMYGTNSSSKQKASRIEDPCLLEGFNVTSELTPRPVIGEKLDSASDKISVQYTGTGNMSQCMQNVEPLLNLNQSCSPLPCAINNVAQLDPDFDSMKFYGLSEFYYTLETLKLIPPVQYNYSLVLRKIEETCSTPWETYLSTLRNENTNLSEEKKPIITKPINLSLYFIISTKCLIQRNLQDLKIKRRAPNNNDGEYNTKRTPRKWKIRERLILNNPKTEDLRKN